MAIQMGVIEASYFNHMPNATKCNTMKDIKNSHADQNQTVKVEVNDIYGMLILLGLGISGAMLIFGAETIVTVRQI